MIDSLPYTDRRGGGTVIEHREHPIERGRLTADLRAVMRQHQRRAVLDQLARLGDLPLHLAMTHIAAWEEREEDWEPARHFMLPRDQQPIVLTLRVRLRQIHWHETPPQEAP